MESAEDNTKLDGDEKGNKTANSSRKRKTSKNNCFILNSYNKKQIIDNLIENGWTQTSFTEALSGFRVNKQVITEYFNQAIAKAEEFVHEECEGKAFQNISEWMKLFRDLQLDEKCKFEAAIVLQDLPKAESLPSPDELMGIDLKVCYDFLHNALTGKPQPELDPINGAFLQREFRSLVAYGNSDETNEKSEKMVKRLESISKINSSGHKSSIDPLNIDKNIASLKL